MTQGLYTLHEVHAYQSSANRALTAFVHSSGIIITTKENDLVSVGVIRKRKGVVVFRLGIEDPTSIRKIAFSVILEVS
ncbi:MAG: hypothetical protein ACRD47_01735 [Nitrososphaeraceae archaeon]